MGSGDRFMPTAGKLWDNLKAAGIDKAEDHKGDLHPRPSRSSLGRGRRARRTGDAGRHLLCRGAEWDFWTGDNAHAGLPAERAGFVTGARRNYAAIKDKVKMVKAGDEIVAGLRIIDTPGPHAGPRIAGTCRRRRVDRRRRRPHPPADFIPASGMAADRRPCAGSGGTRHGASCSTGSPQIAQN